MKCPNYLICNGNENKYNGVCFWCDNSKIGFFYKERELLGHGRYPSIEPEPKTWYENSTRILDKYSQKNLLSELYNNRLTTGILTIEEINDNCPICLENKNIFVKHPTCNLHSICNSCFKETFFDKEVKFPTEPECYNIFESFLDENGIQPKEIIHSNNHPEGFYNCYCDNPKDEWPLKIKEIYTICSDYDRLESKCFAEEEEIVQQCPICRESKLHI